MGKLKCLAARIFFSDCHRQLFSEQPAAERLSEDGCTGLE